MGAARGGDFDVCTPARGEDGGHFRVEAVGVAVAISGVQPGRAGVRAQWRGGVRVDPERPEGVVEIEDEERRQA